MSGELLQPDQSKPDATMMVLEALAEDEWDFRTPEGIARSTGLDETAVSELFVRLNDLNVARHPTYSGDDRVDKLYTLESRSPSWRERYTRVKEKIATW